MDDATRKRLEAIRRRCRAATPAPWVAAPVGGWYAVSGTDGIAADLAEPDRAEDAAFIAEARSDVPWLLDLVEALT